MLNVVEVFGATRTTMIA